MPSLTVGVDEFTLVLQPIDKVKITEWPEVAEKMMSTFLIKSRLTDLYGPMEPAVKMQAGYSSGLTFGNRPWHLTINWNEDMPTMGICVRYSAHAYAAYKAAYMAQFGVQRDIPFCWPALCSKQVRYPNLFSTRTNAPITISFTRRIFI